MTILKSLLENATINKAYQITIGKLACAFQSDNLGICSNLSSECKNSKYQQHLNYQDIDSKNIAELVLSQNLEHASVGLSALNSFYNTSNTAYTTRNARDLILEKGKDKKVGIIGHFPFVEKLKKNVRELLVFEKKPQKGDLGENLEETMLWGCDVVGITATTLINHTLEQILKWCNPKSYKILLGPSTPMTSILFNFGLDALCGCLVIDDDAVLSDIDNSIPFRYMSGLNMVTLTK